MQYSIVFLLAIVCFQSAPAFRPRAFRILGIAWLADILYLTAYNGGSYFANFFHLHQYHSGIPVAFFDLLTSSLFWYAAHKEGKSRAKLYLGDLKDCYFPLIPLVCFATYAALLRFLPQDHFSGFFITTFPKTFMDTVALIALGSLMNEIASETDIHSAPKSGRLLRIGFVFYAGIQILQLLSFGRIRGDVQTLGFFLGLSVKILILLGLIRLLVASATALIHSAVEKRRVEELGLAYNELAHELKTPINEIILLVEGLPKSGSTADLSRKIESAASRSSALLVASRLTLGTTRTKDSDESSLEHLRRNPELAKRQIISMNSLIEIAQNAVKVTRNEKNVSFRHQYAGNCCVECFPSELIQIFINLFRNSCDALHGKPGIILVRTTNDRSAEMDEKSFPLGKVSVMVRDNGEGISDDIRDRVFELGFSTRSGPGRGHGLAVVHQLVTKNSGTIELYPVSSRGPDTLGTEIMMTFPRVACEPARAEN